MDWRSLAWRGFGFLLVFGALVLLRGGLCGVFGCGGYSLVVFVVFGWCVAFAVWWSACSFFGGALRCRRPSTTVAADWFVFAGLLPSSHTASAALYIGWALSWSAHRPCFFLLAPLSLVHAAPTCILRPCWLDLPRLSLNLLLHLAGHVTRLRLRPCAAYRTLRVSLLVVRELDLLSSVVALLLRGCSSGLTQALSILRYFACPS